MSHTAKDKFQDTEPKDHKPELSESQLKRELEQMLLEKSKTDEAQAQNILFNRCIYFLDPI